MKTRILLLCAAFCFFLGLNSASAGTITTYASLASWAAAAGPYMTEDFNDATLNTGLSFSGTGSINVGGWFGDVATTTSGTTWNFATPINALGGNWNLAVPGGPGIGLTLLLSDGTYTPAISNSLSGGFWGFTSSTSFVSAYVFGDSQGSGVETYTLDNMVYSPVPEPATMLLLGTGLVGVAGAARRRRNKV